MQKEQLSVRIVLYCLYVEYTRIYRTYILYICLWLTGDTGVLRYIR